MPDVATHPQMDRHLPLAASASWQSPSASLHSSIGTPLDHSPYRPHWSSPDPTSQNLPQPQDFGSQPDWFDASNLADRATSGFLASLNTTEGPASSSFANLNASDFFLDYPIYDSGIADQLHADSFLSTVPSASTSSATTAKKQGPRRTVEVTRDELESARRFLPPQVCGCVERVCNQNLGKAQDDATKLKLPLACMRFHPALLV